MTAHRVTRRVAVGGMLAAAARTGSARSEPALPRLVALDWGLAATALTLGVPPVGIAEQRLYAQWVQEPAVPAGIVEVGLRTAPSLEAIAALRPDAILINTLNEGLRPQLDAVAPTWTLPIYGEERAPLRLARAATLELGRRLWRDVEARRFVAEADAALARARGALGGVAGRRLLVFGFADARHLRVYGPGSLFADTLTALGLASAWTGPVSLWGETLVDMAAVAAHPDADLLAIEPVPAEARRMLGEPGLWSSLLAARVGRFIEVPPVWAYGELSAAVRFAGLVSAALLRNPAEVPRAG